MASENAESSAEDPDTIGVEGSMKYLQDLQINLDDIAVLIVGEALQSPTMGEFTREGFTTGWKNLRYQATSKCNPLSI